MPGIIDRIASFFGTQPSAPTVSGPNDPITPPPADPVTTAPVTPKSNATNAPAVDTMAQTVTPTVTPTAPVTPKSNATVTPAAGVTAAAATPATTTQDLPGAKASSVLAKGSLLSLHLDSLKADRPTADDIAKKAATSMANRVKNLKEISGSGFEQWGTGDPGLIERRALLSQLMDQSQVSLDFMAEAWAQTDKAALEAVDRTDQIGNSSSLTLFDAMRDAVNTVAADSKRVAEQAAVDLANGKAAFFEANPQTLSTQIVDKLQDPDLRARTMVDLLLQFRAPEDRSDSKTKMYAGGEGVEAALELRGVAASAKSDVGDPTTERDYALRRAVALANPRGSANVVLEARHVISSIRRMSWALVFGKGAIPEGFKTAPYTAIHHNFSTESPRIIKAFVEKSLFGGGNAEAFCTFVDAMNAAKGGDAVGAQKLLDSVGKGFRPEVSEFGAFAETPAMKDKPLGDQLEAFLVSRAKGRLDSPGIDDPSLTSDEKSHLANGKIASVTGEYDKKLTLCARLYRLICNAMPSAKTLSESMFSAYGAMPKVADVVYALDVQAPPLATLKAIVDARQALRDEFGKHAKGYERMGIWDLDKKLDTLTASYLGQVVDSIGEVKTPAELNEAVSGLKLALQGAVISGLDEIKDLNDPMSTKGPSIRDALQGLDALFTKGQVGIDEYRAAIGTAYEAIVKSTESLRAYVDKRVPEVAEGKLVPNPAFLDDFVKEGPLHYARGIAQKALTVGLTAEMTPTRIVSPDGVSVLNNLGRVVFDRVLVADTMAQLKELKPSRTDFCIVRTMDEKKMLAVGGVMSNFPGGYCHAAVYARGAGMAALSNPNIGAIWDQFAKNATGDKLYYDDTNGRIVLMPFKEAVKAGFAQPADADKLKPGANRHVDYLGWDEAEQQWKTIGSHDVKANPDRPTYNIQIFTPADSIRGKGQQCISFEEAGALGIDGRGLGGEKNTVLAMMSVEPKLKDRIPPGGYITTARCFKILEDAGILQQWRDVYAKDPVVGQITDENFLQAKFYTDPEYREGVRKEMLGLVTEKVKACLIGADGKPTAKGQELIDELKRNIPRLAECGNWIMRSSFSAEDRPYKSGAGQYDSVPNCRTDTERLQGVVDVLASAWDPPPVNNNVIEEYNLMHIAPAITAMKCLNAQVSMVSISRDTDTGHRGTVSSQVVEGFGGGVEHGITEEARITRDGYQVKRLLPNHTESIMPAGVAAQQWEAAMEVERLFHKKVEAGKGFAVDMEWCFDKDEQKLYIVQARTVRV